LKSVYLTNMVFAHRFSLNYFYINLIPPKRATRMWILYGNKYLCRLYDSYVHGSQWVVIIFLTVKTQFLKTLGLHELKQGAV